MLIQSIHIKGFREYRGETTLHPAWSEEKNMTLFQSEDVYMLEAIYQACCWGVYGNTRIWNDAMFMALEDLARDLPDDMIPAGQVEVVLAHQHMEYHILRSERYLDHGEFIEPKDPTVTVVRRDGRGRDETLDPAIADQFLEELRNDRFLNIVMCNDGLDPTSSIFRRGQLLLFATPLQLEELEDRMEDHTSHQHTKSLYERVAKIYRVGKLVLYQTDILWETDVSMRRTGK